MKLLSFTFLLVLVTSCAQKQDYIRPIKALTKNDLVGKSKKELDAIKAKWLNKVLTNTEGKYFPEVNVRDPSSNKRIQLQVSKASTLIFLDAHCGWGSICLLEYLPNCMSTSPNLNTVIFLKSKEIDKQDPTSFNRRKKELMALYEQVWILEESVALEINAFGNPWFYLTTSTGKITSVITGCPESEDQLCKKLHPQS